MVTIEGKGGEGMEREIEGRERHTQTVKMGIREKKRESELELKREIPQCYLGPPPPFNSYIWFDDK